MRQTVTLLGDYFYRAFVTLALISLLSIILTPARGFLLADLNQQFDHKGYERARASFGRKLVEAGLSRENFVPQLLIRKRNRELLVLSDDIIVASYPVSLGRSAVGIKLRVNDQKTPEGQYYICQKEADHRYHLFLQFNYPSPDDARRGSVQQLVNFSEEARIEAAWQQMLPPPTDTALGGPLGLHGFGAETNWTTDGSIGLHNLHIEELFWNIATGTSVAIIP